MKRPLGAQISHMLKDRGVDTIFGIPGVHNVEMYRGIEEAGITHVLARHEQGAGFMADGYARATGKPGVAYVITGPGLCNIMTPMGQAYSDSVPMLVISSCLDEVAAKRGQLHQMKDQRAAAETVCDWSEEARTADAAYQLIDRALVEFETQRPRSKHIQVPIAVLKSQADPACSIDVWERHRAVNRHDDPYAVTVTAEALMQAKRPIIVFGGGAKGMGPKLPTKLARRAGAVTFTSYAGRGLVEADYPLSCGAALSRAESVSVFEQADLVVIAGSDLAEVDVWRDELGHNCRTIRLNIDPENLSALHKAELSAFCCDAYSTLERVYEALDGHVAQSGWVADEIKGLRQRWRTEVDSDRQGIVPIADALRAALPDATTIYSDMTQFAYVAKDVWDMDKPDMWHHPFGFGTLGYAMPAAIGGKIGVGDAPVIAIAGDYGFQYTVQELGVAVELGLSLPIILWDNGKLKEIEDCMVNSQIAPNAVQALNPDFCKLAEAWGAHSARPKTLTEMQDAVKAAFDANGPTLIYVTPDIL